MHSHPIPRMGGLAIFLGFLFSVLIFAELTAPVKSMLLGGVIGAFITLTVIKSMEILGPAKSAMFIVITQLIVSYAIELLGIWGVEKADFSWRKALGMLVAIAGIIVFKWK